MANKDGVPPVPDDQGDAPTCTAYAMAKGVVHWLHNNGLNGDQSEIVQVFVNEFPQMKAEGMNSYELNDKSVKIEVTGNQNMKVKMNVETVEYCATPFASHDQYQKFLNDNDGCLILSWAPGELLQKLGIDDKHSRHAIFVNKYNPDTNIFHCLNSWGKEGGGIWDEYVKARLLSSEKEILRPEIHESQVKRVYRVRFEKIL